MIARQSTQTGSRYATLDRKKQDARIREGEPRRDRMMPLTASDTANEAAPNRPAKRGRRPLLAVETRDWMTAQETASSIGASVATVHRLRRGLIPGIPPLPAVPVGTRKFVFRKASAQRWQDENENRGLA